MAGGDATGKGRRLSLWINEADVRAQLESIGLLIEGGLELCKADGRSRRCRVSGMDKEKRGWYRLSEWVTDEGVMLVGTYGIFEGDNKGAPRKIELSKRCQACGFEMPLKARECPSCQCKTVKSRELTPEQKAAFKAKQAEDKKRAEAERQAEIERASRWAEAVWRAGQECTPADHDYFSRKHLDRTGGARIYPGNEGVMLDGAEKEDYQYLGQFAGALMVPMCDGNGRVFAIEFILSRVLHKERIARIERDKEYWPRGLDKVGHFFLIGGTPTDMVMVAEGYATGMSMHLASGLPVAIAFDAGNLVHVAGALRKRYKRVRILVGADDDWLQKCGACGQYTPVETATCAHCGQPHRKMNAGVTRAGEAALAVPNCALVKPVFAVRPTDKKGPTDFNDLHFIESINTVRAQIEAGIAAAGWEARAQASAAGSSTQGGGEVGAMPSFISVEDAVRRYWGTYGLGGKVLFDEVERRLVHKDDVMNLLPPRAWDLLKTHPLWRVARDTEIGFDPTEKDSNIRCNLFGGWPTVPKAGRCDRLLELLRYLCSMEQNAGEMYDWILSWLAYPLQYRGAKMHSALVVHGPQGTGKSRFFEAYAKIFGPYGRVLGQEALEDKFNADWAEKKLFILADEVLARQDMYHVKNRLKGFITGDSIRVNPKNVAAHTEKNQMNIVFLSNERQPTVLENDDRRHGVIWTPPKPDEAFFNEVNEEIDNGGVEALHHYLLNLDLGDFKPWTKPPMTGAKQDLINLGKGSEERFVEDLINGDTPHPLCPCASADLYKAYQKWCKVNGVNHPREMNAFIGYIGKLAGWVTGERGRVRVFANTHYTGSPVQQRAVIPPESLLEKAGTNNREGKHSSQWLTDCFIRFRESLHDREDL